MRLKPQGPSVCGLGGVRPKTVVMHDGTEHIAKFSRPDDRFDVPAAEYAMLRLATRAGIKVPSFELIKIGDRSVLLIDRFDRVESSRIHYASAQSFLDPKPLRLDGREYVTSFSYAGIAEVLRLYGRMRARMRMNCTGAWCSTSWWAMSTITYAITPS